MIPYRNLKKSFWPEFSFMWPIGYPGTRHPSRKHSVEKGKQFVGYISVYDECGIITAFRVSIKLTVLQIVTTGEIYSKKLNRNS